MRSLVNTYARNRKKELGAFYSPQLLSDYLASTVISLYEGPLDINLNVVDPATGESILLQSFTKIASNRGINHRIFGIDIDQQAIIMSKNLFLHKKDETTFLLADSLYPYKGLSPTDGWKVLKDIFVPGGIHFFVSNPPWGADITKYDNLTKDFVLARGQFDIFDLFIEIMIRNLNDHGVYGIIVPDSIYNKEHNSVREMLFKETTIKSIVRLGEGFFPDVNMAASIIFGVKEKTDNYSIKCSHFSNSDKKELLVGKCSLLKMINMKSVSIPSTLMIDNGYSFITDIAPNNLDLFNQLSKCKRFSDFSESHRGVELSKKGNLLKCGNCNKWLPEPRQNNNKEGKCPHCGYQLSKDSVKAKIIYKDRKSNCMPLIVGEDINRFTLYSKQYIELGYDGINYKDKKLYDGTKILVRKTGVGITAGMDYNNCYTNQVVYILRRKENIHEYITNEVLLAILNSRLLSFYYIIRYGSTAWKSNPYISQNMLGDLPFPSFDPESKETKELLKRIHILVNRGIQNKNQHFPSSADAEIEWIVAKLFNVSKEQYKTVFETIDSVEKLIPYKRLLGVTLEDIFKYGI